MIGVALIDVMSTFMSANLSRYLQVEDKIIPLSLIIKIFADF